MRALVLGLLLTVTAAGNLLAQGSHPWLIRARGIALVPDASSSPGGLDVNDDATVELDITRFIHRYVAVELILASASHEVTSQTPGGTVSLGNVNHLPPTLLLQFHPLPDYKVRPYVGVGGNYTIFYSQSGALDAFDLNNSFSWAVQAGVDIPLTGRSVLNLDAKYIDLNTDVRLSATGAKLFKLDINPFVIGAGLGYRF